ncbi:MAG: AAA family ATPase [Thermoproteota archaeon]
MKKLLLITGMPGSGKTTVARIIGEMGFPVVSMGDAVRREAKARGVGRSILDMSRFMVELRRELGEDAVAKLTEREILGVCSDLIVVEGVRSMKEVEYFKSRGAYEVILVGVVSPISLRYSRLSSRRRTDDSRRIEELTERDRVELSVGLGEALALSDAYLVNDGSVEDLRKLVEAKVKSILPNRCL